MRALAEQTEAAEEPAKLSVVGAKTAQTRRARRMGMRACHAQRPRPTSTLPLTLGVSANAVALRNTLCDTPFSRHWQPTDPAIAVLGQLYASADDVLPMIGAAGMSIIRRAWEKAHARGWADEDQDAFAGRFALWLLERLSFVHAVLECTEIAPFMGETLQIRSYLATPGQGNSTQVVESWIRQAEALGLYRIRLRVGARAELDILLQHDDCLLFPVLGITKANASLEARCAAVQDLVQRIVLPDVAPDVAPELDSDPLRATLPGDGSPEDAMPEPQPDERTVVSPQDDTLHEEPGLDEMARGQWPVLVGSPASAIPVLSPTLSAVEAPRPGARDIPLPEKPVVSLHVDEAVKAVAPYACAWYGIRSPTDDERDIVMRRMHSVLQGTRGAFQRLYGCLARQSPYGSIEEFFVALCVHCEVARRYPWILPASVAGPTPFQPGIVQYRVTLPRLPPLLLMVRPSRRHPLAHLALLMNPTAGEIAHAAQLLS